jgi:hypothetical protein
MTKEALAREAQLKRDIAKVKKTARNTRELTRRVAWLLFMEYGEVPTGNRVLHLIGRGGNRTVNDEVEHFWKEVRERVAGGDSYESLAGETRRLLRAVENLGTVRPARFQR